MKSIAAWVVLVLAAGTAPAMAQEGGDGLEACVVASTTQADRRALVRWMFSAISLHGELQDLATLTPAQRDDANRGMGAVMQRLLTQDCAPQARQAFRDGTAKTSFESAFRRVGELAGEGLFTDPGVAAEAAGIVRHVDMNRVVELFLP